MNEATKKVRNMSGETLTILDIGMVAPHGVIDVPLSFNNANFEDAEKSIGKDHSKGFENGIGSSKDLPTKNK